MKIGLIAAMSKERARIESVLESTRHMESFGRKYVIGTFHGNEIALIESGIGKVNAAIGAVELIHAFAPDCIISIGVAGGIDSALRVMDVVVSREIVYHDVDCGFESAAKGQVQGLPARFCGDSRLLDCALSLKTGVRIISGLICSGDRFISDRTELNVIKSDFPEGMAVEMESGAIAQTCFLYNVPFLSFRIISDTPGTSGQAAEYSDFWGMMADKSFEVTKCFLDSLPTNM